MFEGWVIIALGVGYVCALFLIAAAGDKAMRGEAGEQGRPMLYALSLGVYCTSWTFFGSVGLATATGYDFIPVYLGPVLMFTVGLPLVLRIVRLAKSQNLTSVADFLAARYGKSQAVAAVVALVAVIGTLPYIALQLKAVALSISTMMATTPLLAPTSANIGGFDTPLLVALSLAAFSVLFGTRHIDATEHQNGLMLAIAAESIVKLAAFLIVGAFIFVSAFGDIAGFAERARASHLVASTFARPFNGGIWLTVTLLSFVCIILLPRQFHVTVVENRSETEIRRAGWLFPLYIVLINLFVVPVAAAGLVTLPQGLVDADFYMLALPIAKGSELIAILAFLGGLSAAAAMVIVESVALAIMVCNGLVIPLLLRYRVIDATSHEDIAGTLLVIRRTAIFLICLLGYGMFKLIGASQQLAALGLLSFAALAQLAPAFFGGLVWRQGTAKGAIAGILAGFGVWAYTLILPWIVKAGYLPGSIVSEGPLGFAFLRPQALFFLEFEPLTHGVLWSLAANIIAFITVSLLRAPLPVERLQAQVFVADDRPRASPSPAFRLWRTSITVGDLQATAARYLGADRAERSFQEFALSSGLPYEATAEADIHVLRFTEHLLTSAIGAASSRLVLSLLLRRGNVGSQAALKLLDDASEALQYNRDLLQSAIDQVRHGLGVFDRDMRLICWNRQFRELLQLPPELGRVGIPLDRILRALAERGDLGPGAVDDLVADRLVRIAARRETMLERMVEGGRVLEVRTSPMPQGGIVVTYLDITERVRAASELAQANESLERRVAERTAELLEVNAKLAIAKSKADEANLDKTRFLAAASHDILQPLNAARLYATSLTERPLEPTDTVLARNVDASLEAVEEILSALIDISRIDAGRLEPELSAVSLKEMLDQLRVEFEPAAAEKGLKLTFVPSSQWVRTDRRLIRRLLQNLVSNAIKYTRTGRVLVGVRRRAGHAVVEVHDTGPGIPREKHEIIFKEFQRLEGASGERGLGLGLSIVERIGRVLGVPIRITSEPGRGSKFSAGLTVTARPAETAVARPGAGASRAVPSPLVGSLVLCIDNEPAVLAGMETLLKEWGCRVLTAASTETALAVIDAGRTVPDVILADYHLDIGTGLDAARALRAAAGRPIPVVIITADHTPEVQRALQFDGCNLLRKPVKAGALRALMTQHMLRRMAAAE